jgi:hypothetical protein
MSGKQAPGSKTDVKCQARYISNKRGVPSIVVHQPEMVKRLPYLYSSTCSVPCRLIEVSPACIEIGRCASIETISSSFHLLQWTQIYAGVIVTRNSHRLQSPLFTDVTSIRNKEIKNRSSLLESSQALRHQPNSKMVLRPWPRVQSVQSCKHVSVDSERIDIDTGPPCAIEYVNRLHLASAIGAA